MQLLTSQNLRERFGKSGVEPISSTPEQFSEAMRAEVAREGKVVKEAGIKPGDE